MRERNRLVFVMVVLRCGNDSDIERVGMITDEIITEDCRELSKSIPDKSIDLIFTDPPYIKKFMYLYDWLAEESARVLKDDGFLLVYAGTYWKDVIFNKLGNHLQYFFDMILLNAGNSPLMWQKRIISRHKSILVYTKKGANIKPRVQAMSFWIGGGEDKRFHTWGQDESSARYYIDCFSKRGDLVWDPFCGGGTTPAVCKMLDRHFIAFEENTEMAETARQRLLNQQMLMRDITEKDPQLAMNLSETAL